ncbi:hypothetical protein ABZX65_26970 [Streptomyces sp. NPDC003300]|uniref:hypothetical protein n=1 Tax=unclassified Streptomyces TaxID=2593676 RepID=UPI0033A711D4
MTACRPSKPWRVILTGPDVAAQSDHTSETKAYTFVRASLGTDSPASEARIEYWEDGLWRWFETLTGKDMS